MTTSTDTEEPDPPPQAPSAVFIRTWKDRARGAWYFITGERGTLDIGFADRRPIYPRATRLWMWTVLALLLWIAYHIHTVCGLIRSIALRGD